MRWTRAFSHPALPYGTRRTEAVAEGKDWCGGGFPAHEKCPAPSRRAGHFRVRLSGRYNALYLAAPGGQQGVRPGIPRDPVCGFGCAGNGPCLARILRPFAAVFAAGHRGGERPHPGGKNAPAGDVGRETGDSKNEDSACDLSQTLPYMGETVSQGSRNGLPLTPCTQFSRKPALTGQIGNPLI